MLKKRFSKIFIVLFICIGSVSAAFYFFNKKEKQVAVQPINKNSDRSVASENRRYSFGGSCSSQGSWTQQALTQTATIRDALISLRDDPKCKGIEGAVAKLETANNAFGSNSVDQGNANWENLPGDMNALKNLLGKNGANTRKEIIPLLMGKTIDNTAIAGTVKNLATRASRTFATGLDLLDQSLDILPQMDECLSRHPDQTLALFGASLKLTSAFISSGETAFGRMGTTVAKLVTFLQNKHYSKILRKLNQTEYWMSLSCILETTTEAYCSTKDAHEMLNFSIKENNLSKNLNSSNDNPLEGYYLLERELPEVTQWLQSIIASVRPPSKGFFNKSDSDVYDAYNDFKQITYDLNDIYNEQMLLLTSSKVMEEKSSIVYNMLKLLTKKILDSENISNNNNVNFFSNGKPDVNIPFYLIGSQSIPEISNFSSAWDYLKQDGQLQPEFSAPDVLALKIGENLKKLINEASENAGKHFQVSVIDAENLIDQSLSSSNLTVFSSLENISQYLGKLITKSKKSRTNLIQLPNIIDTKERIDEVLAAYKNISKSVEGYLEMQNDADSKEDQLALNKIISQDRKLKESYKKIIDIAYKNFNVLLQKEAFLTTRLSTFVKKEYNQKIKDGVDMNGYQQNLMIIAGKNLMDRISSVNRMNPNDLMLDLSSAQVINKRNLDAVEELFSDQLVGAIAEIKDVAEGRSDDKFGIAKGSMYRIFEEKVKRKSGIWDTLILPVPLLRWTPAYQVATSDYWRHKERYPLYLFNANRVKSEEDIYKSFAKFRSRLCIQALAFQKQDPFFRVCDGASLEPLASDNDVDKYKLTALYSVNSVYGRTDYTDVMTKKQMIAGRERNICAFRDFRSKNYAYWLVKSFAEETASFKQSYNIK